VPAAGLQSKNNTRSCKNNVFGAILFSGQLFLSREDKRGWI
jgi:hypothetical protein